jgi:TetR/AcrR family transcriptional regulator
MPEIVFLVRAKSVKRDVVKSNAVEDDGGVPATPSALPARTHDEIRHTAETEILLAAESVFARVGFSGATIAEIATRAGLPKANLHYYYRTKAQLYRAVLDNTLKLWLAGVSGITKSAHPATALSAYIHDKMRLTASHPDASRVFANEMLHGAPEISGYLQQELKSLIDEKAQVIAHWAKQGLMDKVDARHLFFTIWAATQTYADFQPQVCAVLGKAELSETDYERATQQLVRVLLKGCGVQGVVER